jgi:hypothetical protein
MVTDEILRGHAIGIVGLFQNFGPMSKEMLEEKIGTIIDNPYNSIAQSLAGMLESGSVYFDKKTNTYNLNEKFNDLHL